MTKLKYYYDRKTLSYQIIKPNPWKRAGIILTLALISISSIIIIENYLSNGSNESKLENENESLMTTIKYQQKLIDEELKNMELVLSDMQNRDDNIYRVYFEAEPIPSSIRNAGYGGSNRYSNLKDMAFSEMVTNTAKQIDALSKRMYIQSKSFDEVVNMAKDKNKMLASIPSIQPIANKDLKRMVSGFGMRTHPIYKTKRMHAGIDFTALVGTPIYATGDGVVLKSTYAKGGYGRYVVIEHGYGYRTLYAHMNQSYVKKGQIITRGDTIGTVGSSGLSAGPHLHYEIHKKENDDSWKKVNPALFFYNDLSAEEYTQLIEIASRKNQSFD